MVNQQNILLLVQKSALFDCQCIKHESINWGHYFFSVLLETGPPFYVVIRVTQRYVQPLTEQREYLHFPQLF